jgi:predicted nuclease of predicted toxin-antitoxin system
VRVLLDESLPRPWKRELEKHDFVHVADLGWHGAKNGELLRRAAVEGFAAFVTADRNLEFQQVIPRAGLRIVIVHARTNRIEDLRPLGGALLEVLERVRPGELHRVGV